jgi:hypothetical protein
MAKLPGMGAIRIYFATQSGCRQSTFPYEAWELSILEGLCGAASGIESASGSPPAIQATHAAY